MWYIKIISIIDYSIYSYEMSKQQKIKVGISLVPVSIMKVNGPYDNQDYP